MRIDDYGNFTKVYLKNYETIVMPGHITHQLNDAYLTAKGDLTHIEGYSFIRHNEVMDRYGITNSVGWTMSEIVGMSIVNPHEIYRATKIIK